MSIASELTNLEGNIEDSYDAVNDMGGIIPAQRNMDNLDQAIRTIPQSQGTTYTAGYGIDIDQNDEISVDTSVIAEKTDIPTNTSDLTNDGSDGTSTYVEASDLATVATSGSYTDLSDKPTIPEPMTVYVDASFATPSSITGVFSDSAFTTPADPDDMADTILAGNTVVVVYDGGQSQELIELSSVNSNSRLPEVGQAFTSAISTNAVFSAPTIVTLLYDGTLDSWSVESTPVPTQFSDLSGTVDADQIDSRLFNMLIPDGTEIVANKDLNTLEFLSVNKYYCSTNATVQTLSNCPTTLGFTMEVYNPLSKSIDNETTGTWVYRLRKITDWSGNVYYQLAYSETTPGVFAYGSWKKSLIGSVSTSEIANSAVTAAKIDPSVLYYRPGDTCQIGSGNGGDYQAGRQRVVSGSKYIWTQFYLDKAISPSVSTITFTPSNYNEAFGDQGIIFSINNPSSSQLTFETYKGPRPNIVRVVVNVVSSSVTLSSNHGCTIGLQGTLRFS